MGKTDEIGQLKPIKCTYKDCQKRFDSEKEMKYHKLAEPNHNYCKKCNADCEDWEDLTQHKVEAMTPFLDGGMKHNPDESPKHIVCEFCGMDFKSFGGRKRHREQEHRAQQNIKCPGCPSIFVRAGLLIEHLQQGKCDGISAGQFGQAVQAKHLNAAALPTNDASDFSEKLAQLALSRAAADAEDESQDTDAGGVDLGPATILDREDLDRDEDDRALQLGNNLSHATAPLTRANLQNWPREQGADGVQLAKYMQDMSIASPLPSASATDLSASDYASRITSRAGGAKVYTESYPSLKSSRVAASSQADDDSVSVSTTTASNIDRRPMAWTTGSTSQALFKDAKPTPKAGDWAGWMKHSAQEIEPDTSNDIRYNRSWDPTSKSFDIKVYSDGKQYWCPFKACEDNPGYDEAQDFEGHLRCAHLKSSYRCPLCLKIFRSPAALITHSESSGKCKVMKSNKFHNLLDEVSGGFLKAEHLREPKVYDVNNAVVKLGQKPVDGVMSARFTAKMPHER